MNEKEQQQRFQTILEQHKGILYKVARAYCHDDDDRQDLIQEMMVQIWQSLHKYNEQFKVSTWVYRIALNVAISFFRKKRSRKNTQVVLTEEFIHLPEPDTAEQEQRLGFLLQCISELKEIDRALMLLYLEEKSYKEMAEIMGISESNVATKIGRVKAVLKQKFSLVRTV